MRSSTPTVSSPRRPTCCRPAWTPPDRGPLSLRWVLVHMMWSTPATPGTPTCCAS
jgi:hypothetical protein